MAEALAEKTGYEIVKGSSFEISQLGQVGMFRHMMDLLDRDNIIIDRFYLSNYVYGNLYNYPTMTEHQFMSLACRADARALTVYLTAPESTIRFRMDNRGDDMIKANEVKNILEKYNEAINNYMTCNRFMLRLDTSLNVSTTDITASMISAFAKNEETSIFIRDKH